MLTHLYVFSFSFSFRYILSCGTHEKWQAAACQSGKRRRQETNKVSPTLFYLLPQGGEINPADLIDLSVSTYLCTAFTAETRFYHCVAVLMDETRAFMLLAFFPNWFIVQQGRDRISTPPPLPPPLSSSSGPGEGKGGGNGLTHPRKHPPFLTGIPPQGLGVA